MTADEAKVLAHQPGIVYLAPSSQAAGPMHMVPVFGIAADTRQVKSVSHAIDTVWPQAFVGLVLA